MAKRPAKRVAKRKARGGIGLDGLQGATVILLQPGAKITLPREGGTIIAPPLGKGPSAE